MSTNDQNIKEKQRENFRRWHWLYTQCIWI